MVDNPRVGRSHQASAASAGVTARVGTNPRTASGPPRDRPLRGRGETRSVICTTTNTGIGTHVRLVPATDRLRGVESVTAATPNARLIPLRMVRRGAAARSYATPLRHVRGLPVGHGGRAPDR